MMYAYWEGLFITLLALLFWFTYFILIVVIVVSLFSGPRCGLGELILPENEPGSSIMPVNSLFLLILFICD